MKRNSRATRRGASIIEMMVVGCIGTLVLGMGLNLLRWVGMGTTKASARAAVVREVKMAADMIARDLGQAVAIDTPSFGVLRLAVDRPPLDGMTYWALPDQIIVYTLDGSGLERHDAVTDTTMVVARPVADFAVTDGEDGLLVNIRSQISGQECQVNLSLELP